MQAKILKKISGRRGFRFWVGEEDPLEAFKLNKI